MYKIDTHVHTAEVSPCGLIKARKVVKMYKEIGYDALIITDHFSDYFFQNYEQLNWKDKIDKLLTGYLIAKEEGCKIGLVVLFGIEISFTRTANDYLVYGLDEEFLKENRNLHNLALNEFKTLIKENNAAIYQAHPFRPGMSVIRPDLLDGIEVFNGNPRHDSNNEQAYRYARENNLKMLSGSDFHQEEDLGRGGIITGSKINNIDQFIELLKTQDYKMLGLKNNTNIKNIK